MVLKRKSPSVQLGDRFVKVGDSYGRVWGIVRLWTTGDGLPHARMESNDRAHETRIISVSALVDDHYFTPVLSKAEDHTEIE